ncbi:hypothetical protein [Streptomyces sp. NBC_01233]|uniref:hypothetical protein n=1 Tax=Streptomyces sp. NBC_01233 TaxID=2903787 RepID=UPI002E0FE016|nr:hypothetical protein OG332_19515 [Streptomyces sp. NBC_01233]
MANTRIVTVGAPDDLGLRKVLIDGRSVGRVWSEEELWRLLSREGVEDGHPVRFLGEDGTRWPDQAWSRRTIGFIVVFGLLVTACLLFRVGIADSGDALTYGGRIAGFTILVLALVEVIAAAAAVDFWEMRRWRYSGVVVLVGVLITLLCSIAVVLLQIGERFTGYTLIAIGLLVWSSAALLELAKCRAWKGLSIPRKIAIGAIVSTLLAFANLAYAQIYVPYVTTPLIQSGAEFGESSQVKIGASMYVTAHLSVKNAGQVPVYVLGSIYWIHGGPASGPSEVKPVDYELIHDGEFVTPVGHVLNPGEEVAQDVVVEIENPEKRGYEAIRAQTEVYVIRKDRMTMATDFKHANLEMKGWRPGVMCEEGDPRGAKSRYRTTISNSTEMLNVTRGQQRITVWRVDSGNWPRVDVHVSPPGERISFVPTMPLENQEASERYGLSQVRGSTAQTPYRELLEKARSTEKGASPPK